MDNSVRKRISHNTLALFIKTIVNVLVSLYSVRLVLNYLGEYNFGIYNVIAGVVVLFGFISSTMSSASQRFFAFQLARKNIKEIENLFTMTLNIYLILSVIIILLTELFGVWVVKYYLNINPETIDQAIYVFRITSISFVVTILRTPFLAYIIAKERIYIFAMVGILEPLLKLIFIIYIINFTNYDNKLIIYSNSIFLSVCLVSVICFYFIGKNINFNYFKLYWNKRIFLELSSYSGWSLFGASVGPINNQGIALLINLFLNPIVNSAYAISYQVMIAVNMFASNLQISMNPQIIKNFSLGNKHRMMDLIFKSSRYCFYFTFIIGLPIFVLSDKILSLWLIEVPEYTSIFTKLSIIIILIESISLPLKTAAQASGKIKKYQIIIGTTLLFNVPVSYFLLRLGFEPYSIYLSNIIIVFVTLFLRLLILKNLVDLKPFNFLKDVLLMLLKVIILPIIICFLIFNNYVDTDGRTLSLLLLSILSSLISIRFFGLDEYEIKKIKKIKWDLLKKN